MQTDEERGNGDDEEDEKKNKGEKMDDGAGAFVFRRGHALELCYGRLATWMQTVLTASGFPCAVVDDYAEAPGSGVPVVCFDEILNHVLGQWARLRPHMSPFVLVESEPTCNLANCWYRMKPALERGCALVLTLNAANACWWRAALQRDGLRHVAVAFWPQGCLFGRADVIHQDTQSDDPSNVRDNTVCSTQDGGIDSDDDEDDSEDEYDGAIADQGVKGGQGATQSDKKVDVTMPGCTNSEDRRRAVQAIRAAGLTVDDTTSYGARLDRALGDARLFVYCPWGPQHRHFATQRLLWAIAAGTCAVGVRSDDVEMEALYGDLYVGVDTAHDLARTCRALVDSGEWRRRGAEARARFHGAAFDAVRLLRESDAMTALSSLVVRQ